MRITHALLIAALAVSVSFVAAPTQAAAAPTCKGLPATIVGTVADDELIGTPLIDVVWLGAGDDTFSDLGGHDVICGGPGNDSIAGGEGSDYIQGDGGNDKISGEAGDDVIVGGHGNDEIFGGDGNDRVQAGKGDDYVAEGAGNDRVHGGTGADYVTYIFSTTSIRVTGGNRVTGAGRDVLTAVETVEGSSRADVMRGSARTDDLRGGGGNDRILGLGGDDIIFAAGGTVDGGPGVDFIQVVGRTTARGGADSDQIVLGKGAAKALGGPAGDTFKVIHPGFRGSVDGQGDLNQLDFSQHKRGIKLMVGKGRATWKGGHTRLKNIDNVLGTMRADVMIGSAGDDYMDGLRGNDVLRGLGGNDFLIGKGGVDRADGGPGWDICLTEKKVACP